MNVNDAFEGELIGAVINPIWNALPITYMLLEHRKSFSVQLTNRCTVALNTTIMDETITVEPLLMGQDEIE